MGLGYPFDAGLTIHARHVEVQQHQIGVGMPGDEVQGLVQVARLQHRRPVLQLLEQQGEAVTEQCVVISQNDLHVRATMKEPPIELSFL